MVATEYRLYQIITRGTERKKTKQKTKGNNNNNKKHRGGSFEQADL